MDSVNDFAPKRQKSTSKDEFRRKNMPPGSLMKAVIRSGVDSSKPEEGDQVIVHSTVRTVGGVIVESTRSENGGKGIPIRYVLGKSSILIGLLEGISTMQRLEIAVFKMKTEVHYGEPECPVTAPDGFPKEDELHYEIELLDFFKARVISEDLGVIKKIIDEGQGWETPREPYEVKSWITAKSGDGRVVLSRTKEPFFFTFGKSQMPKGLEMGVGTMTKGEKAVIYVTRPYLTQSTLLPNFEDCDEVHFEIELIHYTQVRDMLGDGRLIKRRIVDGRGEFPIDCPIQDSLLRVHYKGMLHNEDMTVFYDTRIDNSGQPLEFSSGEGLVPEGLEMCVRLMLPGEIALVTCPPDYAYDKFPRPSSVPEGATIQWEVELLGFETPKDWTGLNFKEIMNEAEKIKNTGNRLFKEGKFELARAKYEKVLREYNHVNPQDDEEGKIFLNSRNSLHLNVAACYQKMGELRKSIDTCNKVLEGSPAHVKALYRRGTSYMLAGDFEEARSDFKRMITVDKSSEPGAMAALQTLKQKEREAENKAKRQFKGLFDKKPGEISQVGEDPPDNVPDLTPEPAAQRPGLLSRFWPLGRRFFAAVGADKCVIQ
ncbi:FKBP-type peptidyl-prolyl cis-trans isomerase family protein [Wolffia australiana]